MTLAALLEKVGATAGRRLDEKLENVAAVYDDQLWTILEEIGLLGELDAGRLRCYFSGVPLTRDNIGGLISTSEGPRLVASSALVGAANRRSAAAGR